MRGRVIILMLAVALAAGLRAEPPASQPASQPAAEAAAPEVCAPQAVLASLGEGYAPYVESLPHGSIDWGLGRLTVQGRGDVRGSSGQALAMARRAARLVAARNAILLMKGIRVDAAGRFAQIEEGKISVEGVLRDFHETAVEYDPKAGTVTLTLAADLYGFRGVVRHCGKAAAVKGPQWTPAESPQVEQQADVVIIDARGSGFAPVMYPAILNAKGERVFGCQELSSSRLRTRAMAVYVVKAAEPAQTPPASRPLVLKAIKGKAAGTLVLRPEVDQTLVAHGEAQRLMKEGRLVVLVGEGK